MGATNGNAPTQKTPVLAATRNDLAAPNHYFDQKTDQLWSTTIKNP